MTLDEIIEMARQAGYSVDMFGFGIWDSAEFNRFAKLVAQHERECILDLVDDYAKNNTDLADAIRARGQA